MFDTPYNREVRDQNETRVKSWEEVEREIKGLRKFFEKDERKEYENT